MEYNATSPAARESVDSTALFGWFCTLLHDYPEPEGTVWFTGRPEPGQRFMLPSSKYTDEWEVRSVNDHDMSFTAIKPNAEVRDIAGSEPLQQTKGN